MSDLLRSPKGKIGLAVAGAAYLVFCRDLDLEAERRVVEAEGLIRHL